MSVALARKTEERADPRAALKSAVADAQKARAACDKQRAALDRAAAVVAEAASAMAAASAAVNTARQDHAQHIASAITGGSSPTSTGLIRAASAHERDAQDDLAASKEALRSLQVDLTHLEADAALANKGVDRALAVMMEPVARSLLEEVRSLTARRTRAQAAVTALGHLWNSWDDIVKQIDRTSSFSDAYAPMAAASRKQWQDAIEALKRDPDTKLPDLGD